jgi:hypothetical protein
VDRAGNADRLRASRHPSEISSHHHSIVVLQWPGCKVKVLDPAVVTLI